MIRILVVEGDDERATHVVDRTAIRIGRDPSNDVVIRNRFVSARHGELRIGAEGLAYEDFCTTNGSRIARGEEILVVGPSNGHRMGLRESDELLLGDLQHPVRLRFDFAPARVFGRRGIVVPPSASRPGEECETREGDTLVLVADRVDCGPMPALQALLARLVSRMAPDQILEALADGLLEALPRATHATAYLLEDGEFRSAAARSRSGSSEARALSRTVRDRVLEKGRAIAFTDLEEGYDLAESLHDGSVRAGLCAPLLDGRRCRGLVQVDCRGGRGATAFQPQDLETLVAFARVAASALSQDALRSQLVRAREQAVAALLAMRGADDAEWLRHAEAVASLGEATCLALGLEPAATRAIRLAGLLHGIGQASCHLPDAAAERACEAAGMLRDLSPLLRHRHERWDGKGTPDGLGGEEIPLGARILAVCDAWEGLVSGRGAGAPQEHAAATRALRGLAGTQLDPRVLEAFTELVTEPDLEAVIAGDEPPAS